LNAINSPHFSSTRLVTEAQIVLSPKRKDIYKAITGVLEDRDNLQQEERSRFDSQIIRAAETLNSAAKQHQQLAALPLGEPDTVVKKTWKKKEAHGKASARALTAAEIGERARNKGKKQRQGTPDKDEDAVLVPETPPREALPPSTAPARVAGDGQGKRKRKETAVYTAARQTGQVPSLGHSQ
jgi:hypothetical protein